MNILLIGSGGREHAIAWALQKSPNTDVLYVAPGNGGTAEIAENVDLDIADGEALLSFVHERNIGLVVIGPEAPLVDGVADLLRADGVPVFGPNADGAQLEGSKAYSKAFMEANDIPTAASTTRPPRLPTCASRALPSSSRPTVWRRARALWWPKLWKMPRLPCAPASTAPSAMPAPRWLSRSA